jgi:hypothetical protein
MVLVDIDKTVVVLQNKSKIYKYSLNIFFFFFNNWQNLLVLMFIYCKREHILALQISHCIESEFISPSMSLTLLFSLVL